MKAFQNIHPAAALFYFFCVLMVAMFTNHPVLLAEALCGAVCFSVILERRGFWRKLAIYFLLFILIALTNPLFNNNGMTPLFFISGNPVTLEAILYGAAIGAMLVAVIYWFNCYSIIMTTDKFLHLFGKAIPRLSLVLSMALRFIPVFKQQARRVSRAQKAMGLYNSKSPRDRFRGASRVFFVMTTWSLENAVETADSMRARGYGIKTPENKKRTSFSLFRFNFRDFILFSATTALTAVVISGKLSGGADFNFYPRLTPLSASPLSLIIYTAFGLLTFIPFILEVKESLAWTYFVSKI